MTEAELMAAAARVCMEVALQGGDGRAVLDDARAVCRALAESELARSVEAAARRDKDRDRKRTARGRPPDKPRTDIGQSNGHASDKPRTAPPAPPEGGSGSGSPENRDQKPPPLPPSAPAAAARTDRGQTLDTGRTFNSTDLEAVFSARRRARGLGGYKLKRTDYDRAQLAVDWAREEHPDDPARACELGIDRYLSAATGKAREEGFPFWGWAGDPAAWHAAAVAAGPPRAVDRAERRRQLQSAIARARERKRDALNARERADADTALSQAEQAMVSEFGPEAVELAS